MTSDTLAAQSAPERIWVAWPNPHSCGLAFTVPANPRLVQTGEHQLRSPYIILTPAAIAASSEVAKLIAAERARVMRIAASLFPGGYDNNFAKIEAAALKGAKP